MSTTIDQRVVEMRFDNQQFERNVSTTMDTLGNLKKSLNLTGATKGLEDVGSAAKKVDFSTLSGAVETVQSRFSALQVMGVTALANLTNSAVNAGKRIVSALTIDPIKTGLSEYETQINAVQTILANTESKGTTLQQVNAALDTLNTYADKTIYNFTEMTRNIGTFTAAGVDLNTSVNAIQGIANLAAVSGSTSQQASTAMYQLSQALSSGTVKLMDWNSVVNAGMGGQVFQDALKETARVHGIEIDKMLEKHGSFRETLQEGWITSEILTETLSHFTMAAEEGSATWDKYKKSLMDSGYSEEQANAILKLSNTATNAATKVKTATQLWDTLKETAQSGWTQTWEIILGDFGEAKELFSGLYETLSPMLDSMSKARNDLLSEGLSTGWKQLLGQGIADEEGYRESIKNVAKDHGIAIDDMIEAEKKLDTSLTDNEAFQKVLNKGLADGSITSDMLSKSVTNLADKMRGMSDAEMEAAGYTQEHLTQIEKLEAGLKDGSISMDEFVKKMQRPSGRENLIESLMNTFNGLLSVIKPVKEAFSDIFPAIQGEQLYAITESIREFTSNLTLTENASNNLKRTFKGVFAILDIIRQAFVAVLKAISPLVGGLDDLGGGLLETTASWGDWLVGVNEAIKASGFFETAVEWIHKAIEKISNVFKPVVDGVREFGDAISEAFEGISINAKERLGPLTMLGELIKAVFVSLGNAIQKVAPFIFAAANGIGNILSDLMDTITSSIQNADFSKTFDMVNGGIISAIGVFIAKFMKSGGDLLDGAGGFVESINSILEGVSDALGAFTDSLKADTLKKIATAIAILAASLLVLALIPSERLTSSLIAITALFGELMGAMAIMTKLGDMKGISKTVTAMISLSAALLILSVALKIMSSMSWSEMGVGLISLVVGLGALVGAVNLLPDSKVNNAAKAISKMSAALLILAVAIKIMSTMSWSEMGVGLISMVVGLGALVGAVNLLPKDTALRAAGMIGLATAMVILGAALKIMSTMSWGDIARSLVTLGGSLGILIGAMHLMTSALPGAAAMLILAPALVVLAGALKIMATMSWDDIARGLVTLGGSLLIIAGAMYLMTTALPGAAALLVVTAALAILAPVLNALGSMTWEEIARGLIAIAGAFAIIGVAALVLGPVVGTIMSLSASLALFGLACTLIGVGVLAFSAGLTALAAALAVSGGAITVFVASLIGLIPYLIEQIGVGIILLCEVIAGSAAAICSALTVIIVAAVDALVAAVPALVDGALVLLTSLLESLITYVPQLVPLLVSLIAELLGSLAGQAPVLVESIFGFLGSILSAISSNLSLLIEPVVSLFGAIFQGIADVLGPIIQSVIAPILSVLADLVVGLVEAIAPYLPQLTAMFVILATVVSDAIVKIVEAIAPFLPNIQAMIDSICMVFIALISEIAPIIDSIAGLITQLGDAICQILAGAVDVLNSLGMNIYIILQGIADTIESVAGVIEETLSGLAEIFDSVFEGIATVVTSVGDSIKSVLDGIAGVIDSIGTAALNAGTGFENLANGVKTITKLKLADMVASLAAVAKGIADIAAHSGGLEKVGSGMTQIAHGVTTASTGFSTIAAGISAMNASLSSVQTSLNSAVAAFVSAGATMNTIGQDLLGNVVTGIVSQQAKLVMAARASMLQLTMAIRSEQFAVKSACLTLINGCIGAISGSVSRFRNAGKDLVRGFANGISANTYLAAARARAMAAAAAEAAKKELDEHSPSRVGYEIGDFFGIAVVNGIADNIKKAHDAGRDIAASAKNGLSNAIQKVYDAINGDMDMQPTIRPVVDLSDVRAGARSISGMFGLNSSVGVLANVGPISSAMNGGIQNGDNSDVVSAINKLSAKLDNVGNTTYIDGVTYDDGSNINEAVKTIVRTVRIGKRV